MTTITRPVTFDFSQQLLGRVNALSQGDAPAWIDVGNNRSVLLVAPQQGVWVNSSMENLKKICEGEMVVSYHTLDHLPTPLSEEQFMPLDHMLWQLAIWTAKGRISHQIDFNKTSIHGPSRP